LFLINGRPTREIQEGGVSSDMLESFPVNVIERIEVIKGPGSVLYGSDAVSLVINIITKKRKDKEENYANLKGLGLVGGGINTSGEMVIKEGDLDLVVGGRILRKEDWLVNGYQTHAFPGPGIATYNLDVLNEGYGVFADANFKNFTLMTTMTSWTTMAYTLQKPGIVDWGRRFLSAGYDLDINDMWDMNIDLSYTHAVLESDDNPDIRRNSHNIVAEWTNTIKPIEHLTVLAGGYYELSRGREKTLRIGTPPGFYTVISDQTRSTFGLFTQADYWIFENMLKAIVGIQLNKVEDVKIQALPRGGIIFYPIPEVNAKVLYSRAFRAPSINEIGLGHPQLVGNPNLNSEVVDTVDVAVTYLKDKFQGSASYFYSKLQDIINSDFSNGFPGQYLNQLDLTIHGVEGDVKYYLTDEIYLTSSFMYQRNEDQNGNIEVAPFPSYLFKAGVSYKSEEYGVTASVFNIYQTKLEKTYIDPTYDPDSENINRLFLYTRCNIGKLFDLGWKHDLSFVTQIDNLLDKEVYWPDYGGYGTVPNPYIQGIEAYVGLDLTLHI
jgi:outer membrane receptor for ferrienterochelin and colicins